MSSSSHFRQLLDAAAAMPLFDMLATLTAPGHSARAAGDSRAAQEGSARTSVVAKPKGNAKSSRLMQR